MNEVLDKPVLDNKTEVKTSYYKMYKILIHNDDVNDMSHVVYALMEVFKFEAEQAMKIMMEAHKNGIALVKIESKETAELHQEQLQALSLTATIEPD